MFHITNGEIAGRRLQRAFPGDVCLSWADVLHDGPVPAGLDLDQLSVVRAYFIAERGWGAIAEVLRDFARRNQTLRESAAASNVVLWFEHDLFDQLQMLQVLDWFSGCDRGPKQIELINIDSFPGIDPFYGIGQLSPEQMREAISLRSRVTDEQFALARSAWAAFRAPSPEPLNALVRQSCDALPFLRPALRRLLEEYPSATNGLARSEQQLLRAAAKVATRERTPIFSDAQNEEDAIFMGDWSAYWRLDRLANAREPALRRVDNEAFSTTDFGYRLLSNEADWIESNSIDLWIGGVHLLGDRWRWNGSKVQRKPSSSEDDSSRTL